MKNLILFLSMFTLLLFSKNTENTVSLVGNEAPPISLFKLSDNKYYRTKDCLGKNILVLSFFATWCGPCAKEIPELHKLASKFDDVDFILVDVNEKKNKVIKHIETKGYTLPVILDKYGKAFESMMGSTLPLTIVINKKGIITYYQTSYKKGDEIKLEQHLDLL